MSRSQAPQFHEMTLVPRTAAHMRGTYINKSVGRFPGKNRPRRPRGMGVLMGQVSRRRGGQDRGPREGGAGAGRVG